MTNNYSSNLVTAKGVVYRTKKSTRQINKATCMITRNYHSKMKIAVIVLSCFSVVIIIAFACLSLKKYEHT